jgi:hypothetical protein
VALTAQNSNVINLGSGDPGALHSEALLALTLVRTSFQELTTSDAALRDGMFGVHSQIGGPGNSVRTDVGTTKNNATITAAYDGNSADPGILYRALLQSNDFYSTFATRFADIQVALPVSASIAATLLPIRCTPDWCAWGLRPSRIL